MKSIIYILFFLFLGFNSFAQKNYVIYLKDKNNSKFSTSKPQEFLSAKAIARRQKQNIAINTRDLPVNQLYSDSIVKVGAKIIYPSKWLNALLISCDSITKTKIDKLGFVKSSTVFSRVSGGKTSSNHFLKTTAIDYGTSLNQVKISGIDQMHKDGYKGKGMTIAVLDNGFKNANLVSYLDTLRQNNRIMATYDFVNRETNVYNDGEHGLKVLSIIGAYSEGKLVGSAYEANFILLRTEEDAHETPLEEFYWARGAEFADSIGADIISSSLGYNFGFDNPVFDHKVTELDGNTALITKAADFAVSTGMVVVTSAGNDGNSSKWGKIIFPADGDSVLSVGAVNSSGLYQSFSGKGYTTDGRVKPDVMAMGSSNTLGNSSGSFTNDSGTSFAVPIVSGLVAGYWQAHPEMTAMQVVNKIKESGSTYSTPSNTMGYGIASYLRLQTPTSLEDDLTHFKFSIYPNPVSNKTLFIQNNLLKPTDFEIISITGTLIYSGKITNPIEKVELATIASGMYLLKIQNRSFSLFVE